MFLPKTSPRLKAIGFQLIIGLTFAYPASAQDPSVLELDGIFSGFNMYVKNSPDGSCITKVTVNNKEFDFPKGRSAFQIPLKTWTDFNKGDNIQVKIFHANGCQPEIINADQFLRKVPFKFTSFQVTNDKISWSGNGEKKDGKYIVEKYEYNEWKPQYTVYSGKFKENSYTVPAKHHSGKNTYRIKYDYGAGTVHFSEEISIVAEKEKVDVYPKRVKDKLYFSSEVQWTLFDNHGKELAKGSGKEIDMTEYESGKTYHVGFDNRVVEVFKR